METALDGKPTTDFMQFADTVRIEAKGKDGQSVFGAIEQELAPLSLI
jgi:fumarylacetoacetate (FAA) hydrolase